jgi:undecaprenyl-diphosphatase
MAIIEILKSIILGFIQGVTEWLPISSTGHLIIVENILKFNLRTEFINTFFVVIQLGSILAVLFIFFKKLNPFSMDKDKNHKRKTIDLWLKILVATIPAGIIGLLFEDKIDKLLYNPFVVSLTLVIYGILFILIENKNKQSKINELSNISYKFALYIGIFQMLALIPGTSRSGATILGATLLGSSRYIASEFSFFLAIPTMIGASGYKLLKLGLSFSSLELAILIVGSITAFIVSIFAIKFLLNYVKNHDFKAFGYYRIILGIIVMLYFLIF